MKSFSDDALHHFAYGDYPAPYAVEVEGASIQVSPVRVKCRAGAARKKMLAHVIDRAASVVIDGKVFYAAKWACRNTHGSLDVIFLADPREAGAMCKPCFAGIANFSIGVYRIYDESGGLLYIGSSESINARVSHHKRNAPWRDRIAEVRLTEYASLAEATAAEDQSHRA